MRGQTIRLRAADGHEFDAFQAWPDGTLRGGIVVVQEIFGVTNHIRAIAEHYAAKGYAALAPALFDRVARNTELPYNESGIKQGLAIRQQVTEDGAMSDMDAAVAVLNDLGKVAVVGYCWGGTLAFAAATRAAPSQEGDASTDTVEQRNKRAFVRFHDKVINGQDFALAGRMMADTLQHGRGASAATMAVMAPADVEGLKAHRGADRFVAGTKLLRRLFPDWRSEIEDLWADGDHIIAKAVVHGAPAESFLGQGPAGAPFRLEQLVVMRFDRADGRIT